ncbi:serine/threonine protein kinase [Rhodopirellula rubra]|uniref:non-specific serine/threonine protein kinase n=1 Tax=Aporhodopirellula rubra TaxID=980271 RepID=A0A7W5H4P8_9BACT|nr:serine/threonine-protein kinase [Aporhodopirellula rubra]MBB3206632.1 serine/threonine protein kinase [Aporhodopirellula rubra]
MTAPIRHLLKATVDNKTNLESHAREPNSDKTDDLLDQPTFVGPSSDTAQENDDGNLNIGIAANGSIVGNYELLGEIARGAMGVVYRARHQTLGRLAAIKMILDPDAVGAGVHERFDAEAKAAATLDHPGIVALFETGRWNGYPYFAMAYVDGESLLERLRGGPMTPTQAARMSRDIANAMSHAHGRRIIHRDLKPANILIDTDGHPHITDFGVCKDLSSSSQLTTAGELVGTPHYMPPEQAGASDVPLGPAADVYSIGAVLFAMLTGRPPFLAATPIDVVAQVLTQEPVSPRALNATVPVELSVITMKCLRKKPNQRYRDAGELASDLDRYLNGHPIQARPPSLYDRVHLFLQRHVFFASVSGTAVLALLALMAFVFVSYIRTRDQLATVEVELEQTRMQLNNERTVTSRFLRQRSSANDTDSRASIIAQYEMDRLAGAYLQVVDSTPDLALQLAIEAAQFSIEHHIPLPHELESRLIEVTSPDGTTSGETHLEVALTLEERITLAWKQVVQPMSAAERTLFGLRSVEEPAVAIPVSTPNQTPPTP